MLVLDRDAIADLCRQFGVRRLAIFGSAVTERFDTSTSDVDFLVEFDDERPGRFDAYFGLKEGLEVLLGRPVDLVSPSSLENPYFAATVQSTAEELYAASLAGRDRPRDRLGRRYDAARRAGPVSGALARRRVVPPDRRA